MAHYFSILINETANDPSLLQVVQTKIKQNPVYVFGETGSMSIHKEVED